MWVCDAISKSKVSLFVFGKNNRYLGFTYFALHANATLLWRMFPWRCRAAGGRVTGAHLLFVCVLLLAKLVPPQKERALGVPFWSVRLFQGNTLQKECRSFNLRLPKKESCINLEDSSRNAHPSPTPPPPPSLFSSLLFVSPGRERGLPLLPAIL
jgi:hypothetical protein